MEFSTNYRTKPMNEFSEADINSTVKIAGWVENIRDHGGVSFIDLRDMYGVMQVVMRDTTLLDARKIAFQSKVLLKREMKIQSTLKLQQAQLKSKQKA